MALGPLSHFRGKCGGSRGGLQNSALNGGCDKAPPSEVLAVEGGSPFGCVCVKHLLCACTYCVLG